MTALARKAKIWRDRPVPGLGDLIAGGERRAAFGAYWRGEAWQDAIDLVTHQALKLLPIDVVSDFGARLGATRGPAHRDEHERARANLRRLRPELDEAAVETALARRWECVGRLMAEYAVVGRVVSDGRVAVEGGENLVDANAGGRGGVIIVLHLGSWETLSLVVRDHGLDVATFYEPRPSRAHDYIVRKMREQQIDLLPPGLAGVRPAVRALQAGRFVAIFCDEGLDGVVQAPLFGRRPHAQGNLAYAIRFARRSGAPILVCHSERLQGAHFRAVFTPPIPLPPEGRPGERLLEDVELLNAAIEPIILAHLDQWWFLQDRLEEIAGP